MRHIVRAHFPRSSVDSAFVSALMGRFRFTRIFFDLKPTTDHVMSNYIKRKKQCKKHTRIEDILISLFIDQDFRFHQRASTGISNSVGMAVAVASLPFLSPQPFSYLK
jgi:hypothetical protein